MLELIADGEKNPAVFAGVVGLANWPETEQRKELNRVEQRLLKTLAAMDVAEMIIRSDLASPVASRERQPRPSMRSRSCASKLLHAGWRQQMWSQFVVKVRTPFTWIEQNIE